MFCRTLTRVSLRNNLSFKPSIRNQTTAAVQNIFNEVESKWKQGFLSKRQDLTEMLQASQTLDDLLLVEKVLRRHRTIIHHSPSEEQSSLFAELAVRAGEPRKGLDIIAQKNDVGLFPHKNSYHKLMKSLLDSHDHEGVLQCFHLMVLDRNHAPDTHSLELVLAACAAESMQSNTTALKEAAELTAAFVKDKVPVSEAMFQEAFVCAARAGCLNSLKLVATAFKDSAHKPSGPFKVFCAMANEEDISDLLKDTTLSQPVADAITHFMENSSNEEPESNEESKNE